MTNSVFVSCSGKQNNPAISHQRNGPIRVERTRMPDPTVSKAATSFPQSCCLSGIRFVWFYYGDVCDLCYIHVSLALFLIWEIFKRELKQFRIKVHRERKLGKASIASNQIRRCEQALHRSHTYTHVRTCRNRH